MDGTSEHRSWIDMRRRCHQPHRPDYKNYGARGIYVCDRWRYGEGGLSGFQCFLADMGRRPTPDHTIEREDNDGPYSPDNCTWALQKAQERNKRTSRRIVYQGRQMTVAEAAELSGIISATIFSRLWRGDSDERAMRPIARSC